MAEVWAGTAIGYARAINKKKKLGAISKETSKTPKELGVNESVLRELEKLGWVKKRKVDATIASPRPRNNHHRRRANLDQKTF